jgi:sporulation protein YlmC with PRC-barrel domain
MSATDEARPLPEEFRMGAEVFTSDGKRVGVLSDTLVDASDYELQAIVVKESKLFSGHLLAPGSALIEDEVVVPAHSLRGVTRERVDLGITSLALRCLPPYLSYQRRPPTQWERTQALLTAVGGNPVVVPLVETADKPDTEIEIDEGEPMMLGHKGRRIGRVKEVLFDDYELVGIVIHPEGWFRDPVILPRRFLERSDDAALFCWLSEEELEGLRPFVPTD